MPRPSDLSIRAKLSIGFGVSLALILLIGAVALVQVWGINALATRVTEDWLPEMEVLGKAKRAMDEHRLLAMRRVNTVNFRQIAADSAKMQAVQAELDRTLGQFRALARLPSARASLARFVSEWGAYRQSLDVVFGRLDAGDPNLARATLESTTAAAFDKASKTMDELLEHSKAEGDIVARDVRSVYGLSLALIIAVLVIAAAIVGSAIRWISSNVSRPILRISQAMERLTAGDKSVTVSEGADRKDEIGVLVNAVSGYRESLDRVRELAHQANIARERFDAALTNMSQGLCMFDAEARLVLFNPRFAEIYGVSPDAIKSGMTTPELMALASAPSQISEIDKEVNLALQQEFIREHKAGSAIEHLTDGRTISIAHQPMSNGGFVVTFEDITERILAEQRIRHLAHHDALTDLPNRVMFYEQTESILCHLRRGESVAVMSLDLDHFKSVNDMLGHPVGDKLLQEAAARMRSCIREEDLVARLGGDEFAIVQVPSDPPPNARALAARLIETVGGPYEIDGHQVVVGASVGIAIAPSDGDNPDVLMKNADLALYRAKADGGNVYRFFELEMDARMQERRMLEFDLRKAILNDEFEVFYQPIVAVKSGKIKSCEALIRWHHPERGMVPPLTFIPVAEETGLIVPLGEWVLRRACAEAVRWPSGIGISVNLSPAQFKNRNIVQTVAAALAESSLAADRLELEITELVLLQEAEGAFAILRQLHDLGVRIAMDDFGTGYSSLGYLRSFPFDKIKIDKSFIQDIATKEDSVAIVRAVVGLSSSLGITTTAEGVETNDQLSRLALEGCNEVQGYLFSPPRPAAEVEQLLKERITAGDAVA